MFDNIVTMILVLIIGFMLGGALGLHASEKAFTDDCEYLGATKIDDVVYICEPRK